MKRQHAIAEEAIGNVVIKAERGLDPLLARRIRNLLESRARSSA